MKIDRNLAVVLALCAAAAVPAFTQETESAVPELSAFHEVIYPIWHTAYPEKDIAMLKSLVAQVNELAGKVYAAKLPGILRDKQAAWDQGVAGLKETLGRYEAAAASGSEKDLLDAVEAFHARYEGLVRVTRPPMKELDAFHVPLYNVYHHALAAKDWPAVASAAGEMATACQALSAAPLPKRVAAREAELRPQIAALSARADGLKAAAAGTDRKATVDAVESVHAQYEKVEAMLR